MTDSDPSVLELLNSPYGAISAPLGLELDAEYILLDASLIESGHIHQVDTDRLFNNFCALTDHPEIFSQLLFTILSALDDLSKEILENIEGGSADKNHDPINISAIQMFLEAVELDRLPIVFEDQKDAIERLKQQVDIHMESFYKSELHYCRNKLDVVRELLAEGVRANGLEPEDGTTMESIIEAAREVDDVNIKAVLDTMGETAARVRSLLHSPSIMESEALEYLETSWGELACLESEGADIAFQAVAMYSCGRRPPKPHQYMFIKSLLDKTAGEVTWTYIDFGLYGPELLQDMFRYCPNWLMAQA